MVGLVVVSHSRLIAVGTAELAREVAGPDVAIAAVGGLALADGSVILGTDPERIADAVNRVDRQDGVLILVDLGSALLGAEMAVEGLPEERRSQVWLSDAPLVEGALAAAVQARLGSPLAVVAREASRSLRPKAEYATPQTHENEPSLLPSGSSQRVKLTVRSPAGLHARPAARFIQSAAPFNIDILVRNASRNGPWEDGRSLTGLLALDVGSGQVVEIAARGPGAEEFLQAASEWAASGFGDVDAPPSTTGPGFAPASQEGSERTLVGTSAVEGAARGPAFWLDRPERSAANVEATDGKTEWARLVEALDGTEFELSTLGAPGQPEASASPAAAIFETHRLILRDNALLGAARQAIDERGVSAPLAWRQAVASAARRLRSTNNRVLRERAADIEDVGDRVLARLVGQNGGPPVDHPCVVFAGDLRPSEVAAFDRTLVRAVGLMRGSPTNHAAILLRSAGIPTVVGLGPGATSIKSGVPVLVDGSQGIVVVDLDEARLQRPEAHAAPAPPGASPVLGDTSGPASTRSGVRIEVLANATTPEEGRAAGVAGADGIGLVRTEFLFVGRGSPPDEEEQVIAYHGIVDAMPGRPVTIRTLDAGGDKPLPFLRRSPEANPALGTRGIRLSLANPMLFKVQLRALLRVAAGAPIRIMLPLVSTIDEVRATQGLIEESRQELTSRGTQVAERVDLGIMVETPAAVALAERCAGEFAFVSLGTNDLAQYTMAADRDNAEVAHLADALHPSVLHQIAAVVAAGHRNGFDVGVCGEVASDVQAVPLLLGLGLTRLSVRPAAVASIKKAIRDADEASAVALATACLAASDARAVRVLLRQTKSVDTGADKSR